LDKGLPMVSFPLLLIPLAIYNIIAFLMPTVSFGVVLIPVPMISGVEWQVTLSDILIALGVLLLLLEVVKGARPGAKYLIDHLLSFILFAAAAAEFVMLRQFATSTFFLLTLLAMVEFFAGIALRARRVPAASRGGAVAEPPAPAPVPASPPSRPPPAASVAESVLQERPEPRIESRPAQPASAPEPSPRVASPELQPGTMPPPSEH
jgi:hypothetical protein